MSKINSKPVKLTEYDNVYCNMIEIHNKLVVPKLKNLKLSTVKVYNTKVISLQRALAAEMNVNASMNAFAEYLVTHYFILDFLDQSVLEECYTLINTRNHANMIIGSSMIYGMVEEKKKEINEYMGRNIKT